VTRTVKLLAAFALALAAALTAVSLGFADDKAGAGDTPKAAATRKLLKTKVTLNFKDTRLEDAVEEIKDEHVKGLNILLDTKGGVSRNQAVTYKGANVPLEQALDEMFKKNGLGYVVVSGKNNAYDGAVLIRQGKERGFSLREGGK
jgi:autotransporter-associated beta strand protein